MIDKKKLKEEYKNIVQPKGIFIIRNKTNGRVFMGSTMNLHGVLDKNKFILNSGTHFNTQLQADWNSSGADNFEFEIAETLKLSDDPAYDYEEDLQILEMLWIDKYRPFSEKCYNKNEKIRTV